MSCAPLQRVDNIPNREDFCAKYQPLCNIVSECVLQYPDRKNYNEFAIFCPVHGGLSKPGEGACKNLPEVTCTQLCPKHCPFICELPAFFCTGGADTIQDYLDKVYKNGFIYPPPPNPKPGSAADTNQNRLRAVDGNSLACRPRSPVVVGSHTLTLRRPETCQRPKTPIEDIFLTHVYRYAEDLGVTGEFQKLFLSQLRHVKPEGYARRPMDQMVYINRQPNISEQFVVKILHKQKCFIYNLKNENFVGRPDIHFGDQLMELHQNYLHHDESTPKFSLSSKMDIFQVRIRPCPYLHWLTLRVHDCAVINDVSIYKTNFLRGHRDLGFCIYHGRIISVDSASPAKEAGFQTDYHIVEVNGECVTKFTDAQIMRVIRNCINHSLSRKVEVVVIPERIYEKLNDFHVGKSYKIYANRGFHLEFWVKSRPYGVRPI